jgi:hypothetical protein
VDDEPVDDADVGAGRADQSISPIFRLLGEGRLTHQAVDVLADILAADQRGSVPPARLLRARQIPRQAPPVERRRAARRRPVGGRRLVATPSIDLRPGGRLAGVRGVSTGACRVLFAVDRYEVIVQGASGPRQQGYHLTGQVLQDGDPVPGALVSLDGAQSGAEVEADADGGFYFGWLAEGSYAIDVWAGSDLIVCSPVVLRPSPGGTEASDR